METASILSWTLVSECPIPGDVDALLVNGEKAVAAYKTFRDSAIRKVPRLERRARAVDPGRAHQGQPAQGHRHPPARPAHRGRGIRPAHLTDLCGGVWGYQDLVEAGDVYPTDFDLAELDAELRSLSD